MSHFKEDDCYLIYIYIYIYIYVEMDSFENDSEFGIQVFIISYTYALHMF